MKFTDYFANGFPFSLDKEFVAQYKNLPAPFGFGALSAVTFYRTYSLQKSPDYLFGNEEELDGSMESWTDVCERVINGMYSIQKVHALMHNRPWSDEKGQDSAQEAFDRMFNFKWTPPGRGIYKVGSKFLHQRGIPESAQNCAFISTQNIESEGMEIFYWFMENMMLGVGVGSDVRGANKVKIYLPNKEHYVVWSINDTREAWSESVRILLESYTVEGSPRVEFDYSLIRPYGTPIKGFGGVASGKEPLELLHNRIRSYMERDQALAGVMTSRTIVDIFNAIGACVVAGNVRRGAEIMLGYPDDEIFIDLKNTDKYPDRADVSWASNNSVIVENGFDGYEDIASRIYSNGEPGIIWMDNAKKYGRMGELKEDNAIGSNPCSEQLLAHKEMCTLVELYPYRHTDLYDYLRTIKFAYLYGKTITLMSELIDDEQSREIMMQNRRIGLSNTGIAQFVARHGYNKFRKWLEAGYAEVQLYDRRYSSWLDVPQSIRTTSVKPSGTISILAGATPGVHYPWSSYYIRRINVAANSPLLPYLIKAGYVVEPSVNGHDTISVQFPIFVGEDIPSEDQVSMWEQLALVSMMQKHWADNAVSATIKFKKSEVTPTEIARALDAYSVSLKAISMLPHFEDEVVYEQLPYEAITKEQYEEMMGRIDESALLPILNGRAMLDNSNDSMDAYCDSIACLIPVVQKDES